MDTFLLKSFLALAKTRNFTQAAQTIFRSQSALSLQIAKLETALGKPLFIRDKRNVNLTPEGEQLIGYAQEILHLEEEMLHLFQSPKIKGNVSFGTPEDIATAYLPTILSKFVHAYPDIALNFQCAFTIDLIKGFEARDYDLVLIKQDPQNPHPLSQEVWQEPLIWVSSRNPPFNIENHKELPLVLAPSPCVYRQRAIDSLNQAKIRWRIVYHSPSLTGTLAAVKAGLGVSVLPLNMVPKELRMIKTLPPLKDAQIALLIHQESHPGIFLARFLTAHLNS